MNVFIVCSVAVLLLQQPAFFRCANTPPYINVNYFEIENAIKICLYFMLYLILFFSLPELAKVITDLFAPHKCSREEPVQSGLIFTNIYIRVHTYVFR